MRFTTTVGTLLPAVKLVKKAAKHTGTLPILGTVLLEAADKLRLTCTNVETTLIQEVDVSVPEPGAVAVPVKRLVKILEQFARHDVVMVDAVNALEGCPKVTIQSGAGKYTLQGCCNTDFPVPVKVDGTEIVFAAGVLPSLLRKVAFAQGTDESRSVLCGVQMHTVDHGIFFSATDSHRLAVVSHLQDVPEVHTLLHWTGVALLQQMRSAPAQMIVGQQYFQAHCGQTTLIQRGIDYKGGLPCTHHVIPQEIPIHWTVNRALWLASLRRALLVAGDSKVVHTLRDGALFLLATDGDGEYRERLPLTFAGDVHKVAFNAEYLIDVLSRSFAETVTFSQQIPLTDGCQGWGPGRIQEDDATWINVIMPMQLI